LRNTLALFVFAATSVLAEPTATNAKSVTLDVKDEDVRVILQSMKEQCGIRNLLVDKDVSGKGMVYFKDVPCDDAFRAVFHQFALKGQVEPNIVVVERRER
jgi:type II secretory pathway component HofQ